MGSPERFWETLPPLPFSLPRLNLPVMFAVVVFLQIMGCGKIDKPGEAIDKKLLPPGARAFEDLEWRKFQSEMKALQEMSPDELVQDLSQSEIEKFLAPPFRNQLSPEEVTALEDRLQSLKEPPSIATKSN